MLMREFFSNFMQKVALIFVKQYLKVKVLIKSIFLSLVVNVT